MIPIQHHRSSFCANVNCLLNKYLRGIFHNNFKCIYGIDFFYLKIDIGRKDKGKFIVNKNVHQYSEYKNQRNRSGFGAEHRWNLNITRIAEHKSLFDAKKID